MKNKLTALLAFMTVFAVSAVSCENDKSEKNKTPDLPVLATEEATTEASTTESKTEKTTEVSTEATTEETTETTTEAEEATEAPEEQTEVPTEAEQTVEQPAPAPQGGVTFSFNTLHSDPSSIISACGTPSSETSAPACFANGADSKIYTYDGLTIECYVLNGVEKVSSVTITNSNYSTDTGITIGSSQSDVEAVYGTGETSGAYVVYYNGTSELNIKYGGGAVTEILFYGQV